MSQNYPLSKNLLGSSQEIDICLENADIYRVSENMLHSSSTSDDIRIVSYKNSDILGKNSNNIIFYSNTMRTLLKIF